MKRRAKNGWAINLFLAFIIISLYLVTSRQDAAQVMASLYAGPAYRGRSDDKIALEFAVSWNAAAMEDILATLKDKDTSATFVVSGKWARENADMLKRIADEGHEIGTMGDDPSFDGNLSETKADIQKSLESIKTASGVDTVLYYSGSRSVAVSARASRALGLTHVLSTIDLRCGYGSKDDIIKRGLNEPIIGSIILLQPRERAPMRWAGLDRRIKCERYNCRPRVGRAGRHGIGLDRKNSIEERHKGRV